MFDWKFYLFLYPELNNFGINTKEQAYNHWLTIGRYENKICEHIDRNFFNWRNYLISNKNLIKSGIIDKRGAILHWYNYGKRNGYTFNKTEKSHKFSKNIEINKLKYNDSTQILNNEKPNIIEKNYVSKQVKKKLESMSSPQTTSSKIKYNYKINTINKNFEINIQNYSKEKPKVQLVEPVKKNINNVNFISKDELNKILKNIKPATNITSKNNNVIQNKTKSLSFDNINVIESIEIPNKIFNYEKCIVSPKVAIYYKNITFKYLLFILDYYKNNNNITILLDNINNDIICLSKLFNINIHKFVSFSSTIINNINFIGTFDKNIFLDKDFFTQDRYNSIYFNTNITINFNELYNILYPIKLYNNLQQNEIINIIPKESTYILIDTNTNLELSNINFNNDIIYNKTCLTNLQEEQEIFNIFDNIYVLNLERRQDRFNNTVYRLNNANIYTFEQFYSIDGNTPELKILYNYYSSKPYNIFEHNINRKAISSSGSLAILYSMKNMIKDAIKNNYKSILVLQDDIFIIKDFTNIFKQTLNNIPKKWKLLYLGGNDRYIRQHLNTNDINNGYYNAIGNTDGAFGIGISNIIFQELLDQINNFDMPFDSGPLKYIQKKYNNECYVIYPNLIIADVSESDCRGPRNQINFSKKILWNLDNYECVYSNNLNNPSLCIIIYDNNHTFNINSLEQTNYKDFFNKYEIIILTSNIDKNIIIDKIRIYKIEKDVCIRDIITNIVKISYSKYFSIQMYNNIIKTHIDNFCKIKYKYDLYIDSNNYSIIGSVCNKYTYLHNPSINITEKLELNTQNINTYYNNLSNSIDNEKVI